MDTLREVDTRQRSGEPRRRWFGSERLDLIVWADAVGRPVGFQFCYGRPRAEHALTWSPDAGFQHTAVDDGENVGLGYKATPILVPDSTLDFNHLEALFSEASAQVPADITTFVLETLRTHPAYVRDTGAR